ncbi:unnamed protein product [Cyprideis torosa]|uniref:Uncharacterized protein n=1 Tax=Cyprideis torosa TaxID=163714 RepID=A0A7R8W8H0_9CRUS|nr:unnamed protein product [Cyprideis torosa]CAG0884291.1 unnamed protein product [Cyprideis torosa]
MRRPTSGVLGKVSSAMPKTRTLPSLLRVQLKKLIQEQTNDALSFRAFILSFNELWDCELERRSRECSRPVEGPALNRVPDELPAALGKFLLVALENAKNHRYPPSSLSKCAAILHCLKILATNRGNIKNLAKAEFVGYFVTMASHIIPQVAEESLELMIEDEGEDLAIDAASQFLIEGCCFLQRLYDPDQKWDDFRRNQKSVTCSPPRSGASSARAASPCPSLSHAASRPPDAANDFQAHIHLQFPPIVYDAFVESKIGNKTERREVAVSLLNALGSAICGHKSNGQFLCTPATLDLLAVVLEDSESEVSVMHTAAELLSCVLINLHQELPEQRQVEVGTVVSKMAECLQLHMLAPRERSCLSTLLVGFCKCLDQPDAAELRSLVLADKGIHLMVEALRVAEAREDQELAALSLDVLRLLLKGSPGVMDQLCSATLNFQSLWATLADMGEPRMRLLEALIRLSALQDLHGDSPPFPEVITFLVAWLPGISSKESVTFVLASVRKILSVSIHSAVQLCEIGLLGTLLRVLPKLCSSTTLTTKARGDAFSILVTLGSTSVNPDELRTLFSLVHSSKEGQQAVPTSKLLFSISEMFKRGGFQNAHHFFDIQTSFDVINLQPIPKWPGFGYSFFAWIRLDNLKEVPATSAEKSLRQGRRMLYSFHTAPDSGMETFFTKDGLLLTAILCRGTMQVALLPSLPFSDGRWHSLCITHSPGSRPFVQPQLVVFVDGRESLNIQLRMPSLTESFISVCVGGESSALELLTSRTSARRPSTTTNRMAKGGQVLGQVFSTYLQPLGLPSLSALKGLGGSNDKVRPDDPFQVREYSMEEADAVWGPKQALKGQLNSIMAYSDPLTNSEVRRIHAKGAASLNLFHMEENSLAYELEHRLVFYLEARASGSTPGIRGEGGSHQVLDLSGPGKFAQTEAKIWHTLHVQDAMNCIGSVQCLFPILFHLDKAADIDLSLVAPADVESFGATSLDDEWGMLPSGSSSDGRLFSNRVAGFFVLLRHVVSISGVSQDQIQRAMGMAVVGHLLQKVHPHLLDHRLLVSLDLLVEHLKGLDNASLVSAFYQHVLFEFAIWSRGDYTFQMGQIPILSRVIRENRSVLRKKFGVQFFLDVIRQYHRTAPAMSPLDPSPPVRLALFSVVRYFLAKDPQITEIIALLRFLLANCEEEMMVDIMRDFRRFLSSKNRRDQIFLLMFEPGNAELLFSLLIERNVSVEVKVEVLEVMKILLKTDYVADRSKSSLRMLPYGPQGLFLLMRGRFTPAIATGLLEILMPSSGWNHVGILYLCHSMVRASLEARTSVTRILEAALHSTIREQTLNFLQPGWHDSIVSLLKLPPPAQPAFGSQGATHQTAGNLSASLEDEDTSLLCPETALDSSAPSGFEILDYPNRSAGAPNVASDSNGDSNPKPEMELRGSVYDERTSLFGYAGSLMAGNLQAVSSMVQEKMVDNLTPSQQVMIGEAYDSLRRKKDQVQESLGGISESAYSLGGVALRSVRSPLRVASELISSASSGALSEAAVAQPSPMYVHPASSPSRNHRQSSGETLEDLEMGSQTEADGSSTSPEDAAEEVSVHERENFVSFVSYFLATLMEGCSGDPSEPLAMWKERSVVFSALRKAMETGDHSGGLHVNGTTFQRQLLEKILEKVLQNVNPQAMSDPCIFISWIYHWLLIQEGGDEGEKMSIKFLDNLLSLIDACQFFSEKRGDETTSMTSLVLGILIWCAGATNPELSAMAAARLHFLVQTRPESDLEETAFLLDGINHLAYQAVHFASDSNGVASDSNGDSNPKPEMELRGSVYDERTSLFGYAGSLMAGNLQAVSSMVQEKMVDNLTPSQQVMIGEAYDSLRRKKDQVQESLGGISESAYSLGGVALRSVRSPLRVASELISSASSGALSEAAVAQPSPMYVHPASSPSRNHRQSSGETLEDLEMGSQTEADGSSTSPEDAAEEVSVHERENFVSFVSYFLATLMEGCSGDPSEPLAMWKERSVVFSALRKAMETGDHSGGLHVNGTTFQRQLLEKILEKVLQNVNPQAMSDPCIFISWIYHWLLIQEGGDEGEKMSIKFLDNLLSLIDACQFFSEKRGDETTSMTSLVLGILIWCAGATNPELSAMAAARLHFLVQTRPESDLEETAFLLDGINHLAYQAVHLSQIEQYSFLVPAVRSCLEKMSVSLPLDHLLPMSLSQHSAPASFYDEFRSLCTGEEWQQFIRNKKEL